MQKVTRSQSRRRAKLMQVQPQQGEANSIPALKYLIFL